MYIYDIMAPLHVSAIVLSTVETHAANLLQQHTDGDGDGCGVWARRRDVDIAQQEALPQLSKLASAVKGVILRYLESSGVVEAVRSALSSSLGRVVAQVGLLILRGLRKLVGPNLLVWLLGVVPRKFMVDIDVRGHTPVFRLTVAAVKYTVREFCD